MTKAPRSCTKELKAHGVTMSGVIDYSKWDRLAEGDSDDGGEEPTGGSGGGTQPQHTKPSVSLKVKAPSASVTHPQGLSDKHELNEALGEAKAQGRGGLNPADALSGFTQSLHETANAHQSLRNVKRAAAKGEPITVEQGLIDDLNRKINGPKGSDGCGAADDGRSECGLRQRGTTNRSNGAKERPSKRTVINQTLKPSQTAVGAQNTQRHNGPTKEEDNTSGGKVGAKARPQASAGTRRQLKGARDEKEGSDGASTDMSMSVGLKLQSHFWSLLPRGAPCESGAGDAPADTGTDSDTADAHAPLSFACRSLEVLVLSFYVLYCVKAVLPHLGSAHMEGINKRIALMALFAAFYKAYEFAGERTHHVTTAVSVLLGACAFIVRVGWLVFEGGITTANQSEGSEVDMETPPSLTAGQGLMLFQFVVVGFVMAGVFTYGYMRVRFVLCRAGATLSPFQISR